MELQLHWMGTPVCLQMPTCLDPKRQGVLLEQPGAETVVTVVRRRRTRRHRRSRLIRRVLLGFALASLGLGLSAVALLHLSPSVFHASRPVEPDREAVEASRNLLLQTQQEALRDMEDRPVYPYSVVPGGVKDARELKWVADHDPVVAAHYAGFDYDNARLVRLVLERTVYVSYRIGNKVYWTRHRIKLKKGETVLTDGKITARTRCGNRVEEVPQQATSSSEPPAAKFEEPVHPMVGTAVQGPPVEFQSALLNRPSMPGLGPAPPLSLYDPFGSGTWVPLSPPPLPGVCGVGKKQTTGGKKKGNPCPTSGGGGGEVPEPGTWLLVGSGLVLMFWMSRRRLART
jgi:PEP-CTERM motif